MKLITNAVFPYTICHLFCIGFTPREVSGVLKIRSVANQIGQRSVEKVLRQRTTTRQAGRREPISTLVGLKLLTRAMELPKKPLATMEIRIFSKFSHSFIWCCSSLASACCFVNDMMRKIIDQSSKKHTTQRRWRRPLEFSIAIRLGVYEGGSHHPLCTYPLLLCK